MNSWWTYTDPEATTYLCEGVDNQWVTTDNLAATILRDMLNGMGVTRDQAAPIIEEINSLIINKENQS